MAGSSPPAGLDDEPGSLTDELAALRRDSRRRLAIVGAQLRHVRHRLRMLAVGDTERWWRSGSQSSPRRRAGLLRREPAPPPGEKPRARHHVPWSKALAVGMSAFAIWTLLDAPSLLRSAQGSPIGARRTVSIDVLRPLAAVSSALGLSHVVGAADRLLGRRGPGVLQVAVGPRRGRHHLGSPVRHGPGISHPQVPASDSLSPLPTPSAAAPLQVLSVGDSLGVDFEGPFADDLAATGVVHAVVDAHVDTGLARPDYYDWPAELQTDLAQDHPQAVVVFMGANDPQNMVDQGQALSYGTPAWDQAYAQRVGQFMSEVTSTGARVLWVGMPPMADAGRSAAMQVLDTIFEQQAASHPGVTFLSSWTVLGTPQGEYTQYLAGSTGAPQEVREPDGTHISPAGAEVLSQSAIGAMDRAWGLSLAP